MESKKRLRSGEEEESVRGEKRSNVADAPVSDLVLPLTETTCVSGALELFSLLPKDIWTLIVRNLSELCWGDYLRIAARTRKCVQCSHPTGRCYYVKNPSTQKDEGIVPASGRFFLNEPPNFPGDDALLRSVIKNAQKLYLTENEEINPEYVHVPKEYYENTFFSYLAEDKENPGNFIRKSLNPKKTLPKRVADNVSEKGYPLWWLTEFCLDIYDCYPACLETPDGYLLVPEYQCWRDLNCQCEYNRNRRNSKVWAKLLETSRGEEEVKRVMTFLVGMSMYFSNILTLLNK